MVIRPAVTGVPMIDEQIERLRQHEIDNLGKRPRHAAVVAANLAIQQQYVLAVLAQADQAGGICR